MTVDDFVEISLIDEDSFLKIKETLTRIGIASKKENKLYQSCHIFHKQGKYYIVHFKELFALDGKETDISENDIGRRNTIANLLEEWGLLRIKLRKKTTEPVVPINQIKILSYEEKKNWELVTKYSVGNSKKK